MKGRGILILFLLFSTLFFCSACQKKDGLAELKNQLISTKNKIVKRQIALPQLKQMQPMSFDATQLTSPFILKRNDSLSSEQMLKPLRQFSLNELQYLGSIGHSQNMWAVVATPDSKVYRVNVGDSIGLEGGQVEQIDSNQLEVKVPGKTKDSFTLFRLGVQSYSPKK